MAETVTRAAAFSSAGRHRMSQDEYALERESRRTEIGEVIFATRNEHYHNHRPNDCSDYMAASRRSPLMRDQWRAEDDYRESRPRRAESPRRRRISVEAPRRRGDIDAGLKIKGNAATESHPRREDRERPVDRGSEPRLRSTRGQDNSPRRSRRDERHAPRDTGDRHRLRDASAKRVREEGDLFPRRRSRTRSRSPRREVRDFRDERRRPGSPYVDRGISPRYRHRERPLSPPRGDHYSSSDRAKDSYIPSARHRSRTPPRHRPREPEPRRRRSRSLDRRSWSRDRRHRHHDASPPPRKRQHSPEPRSRTDTKSYRPQPRSRPTSRHRASSRPRIESKYAVKTRSPSREHKRSFRERTPERKMQSGRNDAPRRISSIDSSNDKPAGMTSGAFTMHGMKPTDVHGPVPRQVRPPNVDTRQPYSATPQWTPTSSQHGSPHSGSPYSQGRGGWHGQPQQYHNQPAYSPPYRQNSYPPPQSPHGQYYSQQSPYGGGPSQMQHGFPNQSHRGSHGGYRGGNHYSHTPDRRFSGPGPSPSPTSYIPAASRGRGGHFQNLQWTASSANKNRGGGAQSPSVHTQTSPNPDFRPQTEDDDDNPFRPSKDLQVQDESLKESKMAPPAKEESDATKENKISFAFKAKAAASAPVKPPTDLSQKLKDPPKKENLLATSKVQLSSRGSDYRRDREDYRSRGDYRDDRRPDYRDDRRRDPEPKKEKHRERTPEPKTKKKMMTRLVRRRALSPESAASTSVYYRKPGNESVVGSGTYGKVFKAIHVYTKELAALKKIRMDGEKDGFPVTAVREIKLLQSLRHENIVRLQEVMVENNDCFMVFEYLSHDLTGLLNHPTFILEASHKKHLSRQLFEGLQYLHRKGVLHRDIKAANILVSDEGLLKIADFGLARFYNKRGKQDYTNRVITIWYRSPELLLGETQYSPAVDIWSAACVMVEIFTRHAIFPGDGGEINQLDKIYNILGTPSRSEWPGLVDMAWFELLRPTEKKTNTFAEKFRDRVTPAAFELLQAMFLYDPNKRPTASEVLEHPYFTAEEPAPEQAVELKNLAGDWHEFESKALRKENDRKNQEARRAARNEEHEKEKAKRKASGNTSSERDPKKTKTAESSGSSNTTSK